MSSGPDDLRTPFERHSTNAQAALRPRPGDVVGYATRTALRELGLENEVTARFGDITWGSVPRAWTRHSSRVGEQAFKSLKRGGTLVFVPLSADNYVRLPIFETVLQGITIVGSIVGTRVDQAETFQLHADTRS